MKVRVISIKSNSKYIPKLFIMLGIMLVFSCFFKQNNNLNSNLKINTSPFMGLINKEITIFNKKNNNKLKAKYFDYKKSAVNGELGLAKIANAKSNSNYQYNTQSDNYDSTNNNNLTQNANSTNAVATRQEAKDQSNASENGSNYFDQQGNNTESNSNSLNTSNSDSGNTDNSQNNARISPQGTNIIEPELRSKD